MVKELNNERRVDYHDACVYRHKGFAGHAPKPTGTDPVDHELGVMPLDWVEPKPLPKILL